MSRYEISRYKNRVRSEKKMARSLIHQSRYSQFAIKKHAVAEVTVHVTSHAVD